MKQKETKHAMVHRALAWLLAAAMMLSTALTGWTPVMADTTDTGVTLTVIGDTGDHSGDTSEHTGYVYWMKDVPLDVDFENLEDHYIAKNCGEQIKAALTQNGITADIMDESSLYMSGMEKDGVNLESGSGRWSVIVAYAEGTFNSNGWSEYQGAAELKPGCRLIFYWTDDSYSDCRLTEENGQTQLSYDTDAVTAVGLYAKADNDTATTSLSLETGKDQTLIPKFSVPEKSTVSRKLDVVSDNDGVAAAEVVEGGIKITAIASGSANITASMTNTLGNEVSATCAVDVTSSGTTITGLSFEQGDTLSLEPGENSSLVPVFTPELADGETAPGLSWSSNNTDAATVNNKGEIDAVAPGIAVITANFTNNKGATVSTFCTVTVKDVSLTGLAFKEKGLELDAGETGALTLQYTPANATQIPEITWESSDTNVATVLGDKTGATVAAVNGGSTTIKATAGTISATCTVTVSGTAQTTNLLAGLTFANNAAGTIVYPFQSALDQDTKECTVVIPENTNAFYLTPALAEGVTADSIKANYKNWNNIDKTKTLTNGEATAISGTDRLLQSDQVGKDMEIIVTAGKTAETYTVHVVRESLMKGLALTDQNGSVLTYTPSFAAATREYAITVVDTVTEVNLQMTANNAGSVEYTVNGTTSDSNTAAIPLTGNVTKISMGAGNGTTVPAEYTLTITRVAPASISIITDPADAVAAVYDANGFRVWDENGSYNLLPDQNYTYSVTKAGYIAQSGTWNLSEGTTKTIKLEKAPDSTLTNLSSEWSGFRVDADNQGITSAATPIDKSMVGLKWEMQYGEGYSTSAVSSMILVDDKIYAYSGKYLLMINKETGAEISRVEMVGSSSFAINPPTYANGMIFVGLTGKVQAFDAKTLKSLWVYTDPLGGQPNSTLRYDNGYIYTGFWNAARNANLVCLSATDEDPANETEAKEATWRMTQEGGFYWAGAYTNEKYVIVGTDKSYLYCLDKVTGKEVQKIECNGGEIRSDISYANGRIYFTTKGGYLFSFNMNADGTIDDTNKIEPLQVGTMSTSTPVVYNNRAYVGVTHGGNFSGKYGIAVVDIDDTTGALRLAYELATVGYPQTSGTMTTGYGDYVYVYFASNSADGSIYMLKDKAGMTEADPESGIIFTPVHQQYCICSPVVDQDGTIYFKNDSAYMMAITTNEVALTNAEVTGGNAALDSGAAFNGQVLGHNIVVDPGTESIHLNVTASEGASVKIDGVEGSEQDVVLTGEAQTITVSLEKGSANGTYTFAVRERSQEATLKALMVNASNSYGSALNMDQDFNADTLDYTAFYNTGKTFLNIWPDTTDTNATITITTVSGVNVGDGQTIAVTGTNSGHSRYAIYFADTTYATPAKVKITVTAEDGKTTKDYTMTLVIDKTTPKLTIGETPITDRAYDTATLALTASKTGKVYYVQATADTETPKATDVVANGTVIDVVTGENKIGLKGLAKDAGKLYVVLQDILGNNTAVSTVDLEKFADPADTIITLIDKIGAVTLDSETAINEARTAYDKLTAEEKNRVTNYDTLTAAEKKLKELKELKAAEEASKKAIAAVEKWITDIGSVSLNSEPAITAARTAYDKLTAEEKKSVTNYTILTAAEAKLKELKDADSAAKDAEKKAAANVENLIKAIGTVTINSQDTIDKALAAYNNLTAAEKALVGNTAVLTAAQNKIKSLNSGAKWKHNTKGWWYEAADGSYVKNDWKQISGKWYYFNSNGYMATGWKQVSGKWYYLNSSGARVSGWAKVSNKWYYMDNNGIMQTGWAKVSGKWYYMNGSGAMQTGWVKVSGKWYYQNNSGARTSGWQKISSKWYYMNGDGIMQTGWAKISGKWYYMNGSGAMQTGWAKVSGKWYYLNGSGAMQTGWIQLSGKWYYLYSDGHMAANTKIGSYYVNGSGVWVK